NGAVQRGKIVDIGDVLDVPAVCLEALASIVTEGERGVALDGDVIVVVKPNQLAEFGVTGKGCRFVRHAFHHVAIAGDEIDVVIEDLLLTIEYRSHVCFTDGHSNRIANALTERAGSRFNARRITVLGMSRRFAFPLP